MGMRITKDVVYIDDLGLLQALSFCPALEQDKPYKVYCEGGLIGEFTKREPETGYEGMCYRADFKPVKPLEYIEVSFTILGDTGGEEKKDGC